MSERLYRSRDDRMLAGVAGGVSESLDIDPSIVRIGWVLLVFLTGGIALVVYIVMAIVVPERPADVAPGPAPEGGSAPGGWTDPAASAGAPRHHRDPADRARGGLLIGGLFIVLGALFLARQFIPSFDFGLWWPIVAIGLGVVLIIAAVMPSRRSG